MADRNSSRLAKAALAALLLLGGAPVTGCAIDAATTVAADRPMSQVVNDAEIVLDINKRLLADENRDLFFDVTTNAYEGRVMLTGTVRTARDRERASALVHGLRGVHALYNDLQVTPGDGFTNTANDTWITTKIRARLVAEKGIKSINYRWHTVNGVVYIIGKAQNRTELDKVLAIIKDTKYVTRIVQHVAVS
jgi:osmotically-inducible protein OsmY